MASDLIQILCDSSAIDAAIAELAKTRQGLVQTFLDGVDVSTQLVRVDCDKRFAATAGECRILLQPSDLLVEFLLASRAGERDGL